MNRILLLFFALSLASFAYASDSDPRGEAIKTRSYPGGIDEEDLRVQPQILSPQRKMDTKSIQLEVLKTTGKMDVNEESAPEPSSAE